MKRELKADFEEVKNQSAKYFYVDSLFNEKGITYKSFIKMRYNSINFLHIRDIYTIKGWYILWHMMVRSEMFRVLNTTTINCIAEYTNIANKEVKEILLNLHKLEVIQLSKLKDITYNTPIEIYIGYNTDNYNNFTEHNTTVLYEDGKHPNETEGFNAIPFQYARGLLNTLDYEQWAIMSVLLTKHSYFSVNDGIDYATGEVSSIFHDNHYAFPTIRQIEEYTGISKSVAHRLIDTIEKSKYKPIQAINEDIVSLRYDKDKGKLMPMKKNTVYIIPLFQRLEYIYHHIYNIPQKEKTNKNLIKDLKNGKRKFEEIALDYYYTKELNRYDYIKYHYDNVFKEYGQAIQSKDEEQYKSLKDNYKIHANP